MDSENSYSSMGIINWFNRFAFLGVLNILVESVNLSQKEDSQQHCLLFVANKYIHRKKGGKEREREREEKMNLY